MQSLVMVQRRTKKGTSKYDGKCKGDGCHGKIG